MLHFRMKNLQNNDFYDIFAFYAYQGQTAPQKVVTFWGQRVTLMGGGVKRLLIIIESIKILLHIGHELIYDVEQFVCLFNGAWLSFPEECRLGGTQWMADICI